MPWQQRRALVSPAGANRDNKGTLGRKGVGGCRAVGHRGVFATFISPRILCSRTGRPTACSAASFCFSPPAFRSRPPGDPSNSFSPPRFSRLLHFEHLFPFQLHRSRLFQQLPAATPHTLSFTLPRFHFSLHFCLHLKASSSSPPSCPPSILTVLQNRWKIKSSSGSSSMKKRIAGRTRK